MQKAPMIFITAAGLLIVGFFVYPRPCDGIFEQTAPSLTVKVNALKANGEWAIGPEKIQEVDKDAQKIAVHLKSCCISQHSGYMKPEQYQVCVNGAKDYDAKILQITNIVKEADTAKQEGNTQLAEQKAAEAKATVDASTNIERDLGKLAECRTGAAAITLRELFWERWAKVPRLPQWPRLLASSETDSLRADTVELLPRSSIPPISSSHGTQTRATILPAFPLTARPIRQAAALAQGDGVIQDQTGGATHFFAPAAQALLGRRRKVRQAARIRLIGISNAAKIYAHHWSEAGLPGPQGPSATAATKIATQFAGMRWEKER